MNIKLVLSCTVSIFVLLLFHVPGVQAQPSVAAAAPAAQQVVAMQKCVSQETGVAFACLPSWKMEHHDNVLKVYISTSPLVEVDIQETDQKVRFMSELTRDALAGLGRYQDDFHVERFRYCDRETVKVNGYLKSDPAKRVSDFYLVDHQKIHSVKFTAASAEVWEEHKFLIKQIVESVTFVQQDPQARFLAEDREGTCGEMIENDGSQVKT